MREMLGLQRTAVDAVLAGFHLISSGFASHRQCRCRVSWRVSQQESREGVLPLYCPCALARVLAVGHAAKCSRSITALSSNRGARLLLHHVRCRTSDVGAATPRPIPLRPLLEMDTTVAARLVVLMQSCHRLLLGAPAPSWMQERQRGLWVDATTCEFALCPCPWLAVDRSSLQRCARHAQEAVLQLHRPTTG